MQLARVLTGTLFINKNHWYSDALNLSYTASECTHTHTLAFTTMLVTLLSVTGHYQDDYKVRKGA